MKATQSQKIWTFAGSRSVATPYMWIWPKMVDTHKIRCFNTTVSGGDPLSILMLSHNFICKMILPLTTVPTEFSHSQTCSFVWNWIKMWNKQHNKLQFTLLVFKEKSNNSSYFFPTIYLRYLICIIYIYIMYIYELYASAFMLSLNYWYKSGPQTACGPRTEEGLSHGPTLGGMWKPVDSHFASKEPFI